MEPAATKGAELATGKVVSLKPTPFSALLAEITSFPNCGFLGFAIGRESPRILEIPRWGLGLESQKGFTQRVDCADAMEMMEVKVALLMLIRVLYVVLGVVIS